MIIDNMLDKAISQEPDGFRNFDKTKNVQDQLQEMMNIRDGYYFLHSFVDKVFTDSNYAYYRNMTPTQIWLAFVMKEKYHKIWNSADFD